jgi:FkbM family methyltransferase
MIAFNELYNLLQLPELTKVVDVGSNPIDGDPPYKHILEQRLCRVIGFEPQSVALQKLHKSASDLESYFPYAIGANADRTLNIFLAEGLTSLLSPRINVFALFDGLAPLSKIVRTERIRTQTLDETKEIESIDFLKMDVQGSELDILRTSTRLLKKCAMVQVEVSFLCLYEDQPTIGDIDCELRKQGFVPHTFMAIKKMPISPILLNDDPWKGINQLLEGDLVYVKDFSRMEVLETDLLKQLAFMSFAICGSYDLTAHIVQELIRRKALSACVLQDLLPFINKYNGKASR